MTKPQRQKPQRSRPSQSQHEKRVENLLMELTVESEMTRSSIQKFHSCFRSAVIYLVIVPLVLGIIGGLLMLILMLQAG